MKLLWDVLAAIGLVVVVAAALFGVLNIAEKPTADITVCEAGKCTQFNVRERKERR